MILSVAASLFRSPDHSGLNELEKKKEIVTLIEKFEPQFNVPNISAEEALLAHKSGQVVFLDVREDEEIQTSKIPGAIDRKEFEANPEKYKDKDIIAYCTIGYRSSRYTESLLPQGYRVKNLRGSILSWAHAGGTFVDPDNNPTQKAHVYGKNWDLLPEGYEGITK